MKEVINIYRKQRVNVDSFVKSVIDSLPKEFIENGASILKQYRFIQLIYGVDETFQTKHPHRVQNKIRRHPDRQQQKPLFYETQP